MSGRPENEAVRGDANSSVGLAGMWTLVPGTFAYRLLHLPSLVALGVVMALSFVALPAWAVGALPAPGEYAVDAAGSSVGFSVTELLVNTVNGKFTEFSGHVSVGESLSTTRVQATVNIASVDAGNHSRNEHLLTPEYFDAQRFPVMQFTSTQIYGTPDNFGIKGALTIKGVTKEVVFSARIQDDGVVLAETKIDRTDFGVSAGGVIKNEVRLRLRIRMNRVSSKP